MQSYWQFSPQMEARQTALTRASTSAWLLCMFALLRDPVFVKLLSYPPANMCLDVEYVITSELFSKR